MKVPTMPAGIETIMMSISEKPNGERMASIAIVAALIGDPVMPSFEAIKVIDMGRSGRTLAPMAVSTTIGKREMATYAVPVNNVKTYATIGAMIVI